MSDQQEKPKEQAQGETPFEGVLEQGAKIDRALSVWKTLPWRRRGHAFAILLLLICSMWVCAAGTLWIRDQEIYRSPVVFAIAVGGAVLTLSWLLWEQRKHRRHPFTWKSVSSHLLVLIVVIAVLVFLATLLPWQRKMLQFRYHNELKNLDLSPDLYDYQSQLESLTVKNDRLTDLAWLDSASLTDLTVASQKLRFLNGLASVPQLRSLDLDLRRAPINSLSDIGLLHHLQTLVLRNLGRAKIPLAVDLGAFPELKELALDFERSNMASLPELATCEELQDLKLNLRATTRVLNLPDMSTLHRVHTAAVFVDNSSIIDLRPLVALDHLQSLTLSLDGTQLQLLQDWLSELKDKHSPESLSLLFVTPPNGEIPNLSGIKNLTTLEIKLPESRTPAKQTVVPDPTYLNKLKGLTISIKGSDANTLPNVGSLPDLLSLNLDVESSGVATLPIITGLNRLQQLTINVNSTAVRELPDFTQTPTTFPDLRELNLLLANSEVRSLHGINQLKNLTTLSLDIRGVRIDDLDSITKIDGLQNLSVRLQWSQIGALPKLETLKNLSTLKLQLDDYWNNEELPDLSHLSKLTAVTLVLVDSQVKNLALLEKISTLTELYVEGHSSGLETLPDLTSLTNLRTVEADISDTKVKLKDLSRLKTLQKLTVDSITFPSLEGLPKSVRKLVIVSAKE